MLKAGVGAPLERMKFQNNAFNKLHSWQQLIDEGDVEKNDDPMEVDTPTPVIQPKSVDHPKEPNEVKDASKASQHSISRKWGPQRKKALQKAVRGANNRYPDSELPQSSEKVSAILRQARLIKEQARHRKNPQKETEVAALSIDPTDEEATATWAMANLLYKDTFNLKYTVDLVSPEDYEDADDEFEIAPIEIIAEASKEYLNNKKKVEWRNIPKKYDQEFVSWDLDLTDKTHLQEYFSRFKDCLVSDEESIPLGQAKVEPFDITLKDGGLDRLSTKFTKSYPVKGELREKLRQTLDEMEEAGVGRPAPPKFAAPFAFPGFFAKRPRSTKLRLCVNFSGLNEETVPEAYPMPTIQEIHEQLGGKKIISVMDLKSGYMQCKLTQRARELCLMTTPLGIYQFDVLGFGLRNAVAYFQKTMNHVFAQGIRKGWVHVYVDDIIIATANKDEHMQALEYVFTQLQRFNLKVALPKCHFFLKQAKVLGQIIGEEGVGPDPTLIEAVRDFPTPHSTQAVREFLGLTGHYRHYIRRYADIADPLNALLRGREKFRWNAQADAAFKELKQALLNAPILMLPDFNKPFRLESDASLIGAGCVLAQHDEEANKWRPVAFASWLFNSAQRNYSTTDRELLAIVLAARKFRPFLFGRTFTVLSDHAALSGNIDVSDPHSRIARWYMELSQYDLKIEYIAGKSNKAADALSRNFNLETFDDIAAAASEILSLPSDEEWVAEQAKDPDFGPIIRWIEKEELPSTDQRAREIVREAAHYYIDEKTKVLYRVVKDESSQIRKCRRAVPQALRKLLLTFYHDSMWSGAHMGRDKTYQKISKDFYFPDMYRYVAVYVQTCVICQRVKDGRQVATAPLGSIPTTERWDILSIDLWGPLPVTSEGNKYVLTVVDSFTKWARAIPIPNKKMETVAKALWRNVFSIFGMPNRIHHDQGSEFVNGVLKALTDMLLIDDSRTTAYHPQGNAFAERIHQFFGRAISAYVREDQRNWDDYIDAIILAYNSTVHDSTGFSPAELMLGRDLRAPGALRIPDSIKEPDHKAFAKRFHEIITKAQLLVMTKLDATRLKRALKAPEVPLTSFKEGEQVMLYVPRVKPGKVHKLTPYWTGPFKVLKRGLNDKVYYLENEFGEKVTSPVSLSRLKPFHNRKELDALNREEETPANAIREDISEALIQDGAVARAIKVTEELDVAHEFTVMDREGRDLDGSHDFVNPSVIFGKAMTAMETKKSPKSSTSSPRPNVFVQTKDRKSRDFKGDEYLVTDQGVFLKSRIAAEGPRWRKPSSKLNATDYVQ